jgi:hypothetical protein
MDSASTRPLMMSRLLRPVRQYGVLVAVTALSLYYLYRAVYFRFVVPDRLGPALFNKQLWYVSHLLFAIPVVLGAPLQFIAPLRRRAPQLHHARCMALRCGAKLRGPSRLHDSQLYDGACARLVAAHGRLTGVPVLLRHEPGHA